MRPLFRKTLRCGYLFTLSPILLSIPLSAVCVYYVAHLDLHVGLMDYDSILFGLMAEMMAVLGITGLILMIVALTAHLIDELAHRILKHPPDYRVANQ
jgi:hypothetical protein